MAARPKHQRADLSDSQMPAIHTDIMARVYEHARECYPDECCGFICASGYVHRATNIQNDLHGLDAQRHPRDAKRAYTFSAEDALRLNRSFGTADPAVMIYHSHPDTGAYFSEKDVRNALYQGRPLHNVDFLVVDVRKGLALGAKLFRFTDPCFECIWTGEV
jgi:adenylyltransferase/sulfurtransferase